MVVGYIKEERLKFFQHVKLFLFDGNYVIAVSQTGKNKERVRKKVSRYIEKLGINALVFSKDLEESFKSDIYTFLKNSNKVQVLNGKKLMGFMKFEVVKYVLNKQKVNSKEEEIYIVFKKSGDTDLKLLKKFIENFRVVNVVTNDIERLKNVQDNLLENDGILISVSNNKRKALKRAKYVLNINLNKEELEKYRMNRDAIIVNIQENVRYGLAGFEGININNIKIKCPDEFIEKFEQIGDNFEITELYEGLLLSDDMQRRKAEEVIERIEKDDVKINEIIGNNGVIHEEELRKKPTIKS